MSRFLHRPMFRRGGSTGGGITSGLTRQGYQGTDDPTDQRVKPKDSSGADFWLNFGTNILAQPGGRPILQTLGTAAKEPLSQFQGQDISRLGSAGAIQQAQTQATLDAQREANRMAAYEPYERLGYMGAGIGNVLGGMQGQYNTTVSPNPTPLQSALGILSTGAGVYDKFK